MARRLTQHGKLSKGEAKKLANAVTKEMGKSAGMTNRDDDPLRMAVSKALFGVPVPPNAMGQAKVRLRLYAGLNDWALDAIFKPRPGVLAECQQGMSLAPDACEALVAAAGRISLADARKLGGGAPQTASTGFGNRRFGGASGGSRFGQRPAAAPGGSRFQRYDSGFRGAAPRAAPRFGGNAQGAPRFGSAAPRRAARPAPRQVARPAPAPRAAYNTKAEYQRRRAEYLARQKARMQERKTKVVAVAGGTDKAERGPGSAEEAAAAGLPPPEKKEASAKAAPASSGGAADAPAEEAPAPKKPAKAALDNDFLNSLLDDPLGK